MYLHLGQNIVVPESTVIGIFDLDNSTSSHITRKFLSDSEKSGRVINVTEELPRSFVVCREDYKDNIYLSQLSSQTLMKRSGGIAPDLNLFEDDGLVKESRRKS
ncbi:MAG: DUF370 domain-containing protein [Oscillospiraceae bacterium]|nr:DUF370 domain-containing protein [Oscillospiraceae bacterium]